MPDVPEELLQASRADAGKDGRDGVEEWIPQAFDGPVARPLLHRSQPASPKTQTTPRETWAPGPSAPIEPPIVDAEEAAQRAASAEKRAETAEKRAETAEKRAEAAEKRAEAAHKRAETAEERVRDAEGRVVEAEENCQRAEERRDQAEQELATLQERAETVKRAAARSAAERFPDAEPPAREAGGSGLNEITFEALRELGLSVNQAARFIAQRDQRHGLRDVDEIDRMLGLPRDVKDKLKQVGSI